MTETFQTNMVTHVQGELKRIFCTRLPELEKLNF